MGFAELKQSMHPIQTQTPQKQRIQSANSAKGDIKSIIAKAVAATMDERELANKAEQAKDAEKAKGDFQASQW